MKLYKFSKIVSVCDVEVWAESEREAFNEVFDDAEWDYEVEVISEKPDDEDEVS